MSMTQPKAEQIAKNESVQKDVRPFGFRDKLGYLFGDLGNDFFSCL